MNKILKRILITIGVMAGVGGTAWGNMPALPKDTIDPVMELMNVCEVNRTSGSTVMNYSYYVEEKDSGSIVRDSLWYKFKYEGNKYRFTLQGITQVQDGLYKLTIYNNDSMLYVEKASSSSSFQPLFQVNILDRNLRLNYVDTVTISDSAGTRKITYRFRDLAPVIYYTIAYDKGTYQIRYMQYEVRKELPPANSTGYVPARYRRITLKRSADTADGGTYLIDTGQFFTRQSGVLTPAPAYNNYRIIDASK